MERDAVFSPTRRYRYGLWRIWGEGPLVLFIGLNPSKADEHSDDPTIRRCIGYGRDWGYGGLAMANLFAYRATRPSQLKKAKAPVGPDNDAWLERLAGSAALVVAAWGNDGAFMGRDRIVRRRLQDLRCLKVNSSGQPAHPLYQPKGALPIEYTLLENSL